VSTVNKQPKKLDDLTLDEKIGQMIVAANWPEGDSADYCVTELKCGGIWPVGCPNNDLGRFRDSIRQMQSLADIPLFILSDFECGAGQLITGGSCVEFPALMAYGAIADINDAMRLAYESGRITAMEAEYIGVNITPGPVFDVNTVPENPISNTRSVSDNPEKVWRIAGAYAGGMQTGRLLPQAKHFPGEGMHRFDPHLDLERMQVTEEEMETIHILPFRKAMEMGVPMMMTNHAIYPCYDDDLPCTLSEKLISGVLRNRIGFDGLVITDAMAMHGITSRFGSREALVKAINAGNDLILDPMDKRYAIEWVKDALDTGRIKMETINRAVGRILWFKKNLRLFDVTTPSDTPPAVPFSERKLVAKEVAEKSITLIRDTESLLPVRPRAGTKVLLLEPAHPRLPDLAWGLKYNLYSISDCLKDVFDTADIRHFGASLDGKQIEDILSLARQADYVFVSTSFKSRAGQVGLLNADQVSLVQAVVSANRRTVIVASNPYVAAELPFAGTIIANYGPYRVSVEAARDVILGRISAAGVLPVQLPESIDPSAISMIAHD
jgi:beta-N-acetylhexosaminidase